MARDHTRVNIDIWGDDDFRDLPVDAQNLYWTLWTSPDRTYCGAHEWRPGKLSQCAGDWTVARVIGAGAVLAERLFLLVDDTTEECLIRSWIKHDGLWRIPNMAVTMANARSALGSKTLRGVVVHEVKKLVKAEPDLGSWKRDEVKKLLAQRSIDPATVDPFNPGPNGGGNPAPNPGVNPAVKGYGQLGVNPPVNPAPTTATASPTTDYSYKEGYVSQVSHLEPPSRCPSHINHSNPPKCPACADARRAHDAWKTERDRDELTLRRAIKSARESCPECDSNGLIETPGGMIRCTAHQEPRHA